MVSSSEPVIESSSKTQKWSRAQFDVNIPLEESCLLTLISADDDGNLVVLGNGFIISNQGPYAICISAAHCFEEAKKHQWAATVTPCPTLPDVFKSKATEYIRPDGIAAAYLTPKGPICCRICDINYIANYDGSLFTIRRVPPESGHVFEAHIELDLGMPAVGDEVGVMAHRLEIEQRAPGEAELRRKIEFCFGTVTAVQTEQRRMGQMCWFETTIPFHPGMSGAPLVRAPRPGIVVAACGIVSSDFSSEAAMNSFSEPGRGTAAMIWPAMALGLKVRRSDQPAAFAYLSELVDQGIIRNQNSEVSVVVRRGPNQIELHYTDRHPTSAKKIVLQTAAHPLASSL